MIFALLSKIGIKFRFIILSQFLYKFNRFHMKNHGNRYEMGGNSSYYGNSIKKQPLDKGGKIKIVDSAPLSSFYATLS